MKRRSNRMFPVLTAWGFTTEENRVPPDSEMPYLLRRRIRPVFILPFLLHGIRRQQGRGSFLYAPTTLASSLAKSD